MLEVPRGGEPVKRSSALSGWRWRRPGVSGGGFCRAVAGAVQLPTGPPSELTGPNVGGGGSCASAITSLLASIGPGGGNSTLFLILWGTCN